MTASWPPPPHPMPPPPGQSPTQPPAAPPPPRRRRAWPWIVGTALLLTLAISAAALAWWFQPVRQFERADPEGHAACEALAAGLRTKNAKKALNALFEAAEHAALAETNDIEATVIDSPVAAIPDIVDVPKLRDACEGQGFDVPAVQSKSDSASSAAEAPASTAAEEITGDPEYTRTYSVTSDGPVDVSYSEDGGSGQVSETVESGWSKTVSLDGPPKTGWSFIASPADGTTTVTCNITDADSKLTATATSSDEIGAYCAET